MKNINDFDEEDNPQCEELDEAENDAADYDPTIPPVLQDDIEKTIAVAETLAGADGTAGGHLFFGERVFGHTKYKQDACSAFKEVLTCVIYTGNDGAYIGWNDYTVGSIFCYLGRGTHPATGEDCQVIEFLNTRGKVTQQIIPFPIIAKGGADLAGFLSASGFKVGTEPKARAVTQAILNGLRGRHVEISNRLGWVTGKLQFAYKDRVIGGGDATKVVFATEAFRQIKTGTSGSDDEWRAKVAAPLRGNCRPILMTCTMLASPFLRFAPQADPLTINIYGDTTDGKSTEAYCAGSVHGGGEGKTGFMHTWDGTAGAIQAIAAAHSDQGVIFDEISQAGEQGQRTAYAIHNGAGRNRLNRDASLRRSEETRTFVLSTGETHLFEMSGLKGKPVMYGGLEARTVNIPSNAGGGLGIYEDLHGLPHTKEGARRFANKRKLAASLHYGHAGPMVVQGIIDECNEGGEEAFRRRLAKMIETFVEDLELPDDADAAIRRVATSFGLICAAGRYACRWDVLPLDEDEIVDAVVKCFRAWIADRGGTKAKTTVTALVALRDYIAKNQGRFVQLHEATTTQVTSLCGYKDDRAFYVLPSAWTEVIASAPRARLVEELDRLGLLNRQQSARGDQITKKLPHSAISVKCYSVSARILAIENDGTLGEFDNHKDDDAGNIFDLNVRRAVKTLRSSSR